MLAVVLACMAVAEAAPCASGCDGKHVPVCGADGFTYHSACVADCQGIKIVSTGPCPNKGGFLQAHGKQIGQADMDRFKADGYRLVGPARSGVFDPALGSAILGAAADKARLSGQAAAIPATEQELTTMRYTPDGLVYAKKMPTAQVIANALAEPQTPPMFPLEEDNAPLADDEEKRATAAERKLLTIFGADNRVQITTTGFPRSAGGQLSFSVGTLGYACSGAMISTRTVLTAGHCVFDRTKQMWASGMTFSPNQITPTNKPYGTFAFSYLQTFSGWTNLATANAWPYDMGVVQLADTTVGTRTGYFGLTYPSAGYTQTLNTEGYPGDKPWGTYWRTSCSVTDSTRNDGQILHQCDTFSGQSGSPMFNSANYIIGVHSWSSATSNGASELRPEIWATVLNWR